MMVNKKKTSKVNPSVEEAILDIQWHLLRFDHLDSLELKTEHLPVKIPQNLMRYLDVFSSSKEYPLVN